MHFQDIFKHENEYRKERNCISCRIEITSLRMTRSRNCEKSHWTTIHRRRRLHAPRSADAHLYLCIEALTHLRIHLKSKNRTGVFSSFWVNILTLAHKSRYIFASVYLHGGTISKFIREIHFVIRHILFSVLHCIVRVCLSFSWSSWKSAFLLLGCAQKKNSLLRKFIF